VGSAPTAVTAADVNGDGKVDLISANEQSGSLTVLTNEYNSSVNVNFTGAFSGSGAGLTGVSASAITGGLSTNIVIGGHTFYITNGIIFNIQ
jgi:hypothetical protein